MNKMEAVSNRMSGKNYALNSLLNERGCFGPEEQASQHTNHYMGYQSQEMVIKHFKQNP
jgi:hypothetical protein